MNLSEVALSLRQLFQNAKWKVLNDYVKDHLANIESIDSVTNLNKYITKPRKLLMEGIDCQY